MVVEWWDPESVTRHLTGLPKLGMKVSGAYIVLMSAEFSTILFAVAELTSPMSTSADPSAMNMSLNRVSM